MPFAWNAEQRALRDAVRGLLARKSDSAAVRAAVDSPSGYDASLWSTLCAEIGVASLSIPEEYGGFGASLLETVVVQEELGRTLTPSPMLGSAVLTAQALLAIGDREACGRLLPGIAAGRIAALAVAGPQGRWAAESPACRARAADDGWLLDGEAHYVLDGDVAEVLLVVASTDDGVGLFEVEPNQPAVRREQVPTMDLTRRLAVVRLAEAPGRRIGAGDVSSALRQALDVACVALAGEAVGAASRALELTVDYTKNRVQFGRPIGSFQALKHRMAEMYVLVETARSTCYAAAWEAASGGGKLAEYAATAKVHCCEAFQAITTEMIQLHGGIAITWEHDAHFYFKRAHGSAHLFGHPADHVSRLADLVGI